MRMLRIQGSWALTLTLTLTLVPVAAPAFELRDPLRGGTAGTAVGGRFDADGWHAEDRRDRIWFSLPRLVEGSLAFTVAGIRVENLVLGDHELFAMYEAGYGLVEPIPYNPEFRGNHYKCLLRIYGQPEPDRLGAQKLMWGLCPSGAPGFGDCGCGSFFEEPFGGDPRWDGAATRIRVEWGGGVTRLLRDEVEALRIDWSGRDLAFGPSALHLTLGSPRASAVDDAGLPVGAVFTDLVVTGVEGPLAVCGNAPVEPPVEPPVDAGSAPPEGEGLRPTDDVTVDIGLPDTVFPDTGDLAVESAEGASTEVVYLRFEVPRPVRRAVLRLTARGDASAEGDGATVHAVEDTRWREDTLVFEARPAETPGPLGSTGPTLPAGVYEVDVTAAAHAGALAFALRGGANSSHFSSKEDVGGAAAPRLFVDYAPDAVETPDASAPAPSSDLGAGGADAIQGSGLPHPNPTPEAGVPGPAAATRADAESDEQGESGESTEDAAPAGCYCRAAGRTPARTSAGLGALLWVAGWGRRRRRRS